MQLKMQINWKSYPTATARSASYIVLQKHNIVIVVEYVFGIWIIIVHIWGKYHTPE